MAASIVAAVTTRASSQHGLITLDQLRDLEVSPHQLRSLVGSGWLRSMAPRVYGINGVPTTVDRRLTLGLLCLGPHAVVSHEAAARLHGFDRSLPDAVEFTVSRQHRHASRLLRVHSTATMPAIDRVTVGGDRCTSATRTIIDLARTRIPTVRLEAAIDSAVRSGATAPVVLAQRLASLRGPGRWGARTHASGRPSCWRPEPVAP